MGGRKKKLLTAVAVLAVSAPLAFSAWANGPETVELDSLAQYYGPVTFDHAMHADLAESCADCHHHTTGTEPTNATCARCHTESDEASAIACKDCHSEQPFSAASLKEIENNPQLYHTGKPGLKGAYHQNCLGCHESMGGPTGCQDCHTRNEEGDKLFHAGNYAPEPSATQNSGH